MNFHTATYKRKPGNNEIQQGKGKGIEFKEQQTAQKIGYATNSVSFGHKSNLLCQENPSRQNTSVSYSKF